MADESGLSGLRRLVSGGNSTMDEVVKLQRILDALGLLPPPSSLPEEALSALPAPQRERPGLYWDARHPSQGGTQRVESSIGAPSADHYRLVDSMEEANDVMGRGEKPLLIGNIGDINPDDIDPQVLRQLQEDQWAAPGGTPLFGGR